MFPLTRPTLFYCPDPTYFIGKLVDKELKGWYKTVIPPSRDCKSAGHWTILMKPYEKGNKSTFQPIFLEITHKIKKNNKIYFSPTDPNFFGNVSGNSTLIFLGLIMQFRSADISPCHIATKYCSTLQPAITSFLPCNSCLSLQDNLLLANMILALKSL